MIKLLWLLSPLLALGLAWAALAWRGRAPSRLTLNVVLSLLLLAYLSATAGLGLFWVAHQQLPVFDWHYLFGYVTLALVLLHLGFNARVVWAWWRRSRAATPADPTPNTALATPTRRQLLRRAGLWPVLASLGSAGAGYWIGLRQGRAVVHLSPAAAAPTSATATMAAPHTTMGNEDAPALLRFVERFHAHTSHTRASVLRTSPGSAWARRPEDFKTYPAASRLALPAPTHIGIDTTHDPIAALGSLLWHGAGISAQRGPLALRASPSSGALFASELYLQVPPTAAQAAGVGACSDADAGAASAAWARLAGCWHHAAQMHALERLPMAVVDTSGWTTDAAGETGAAAPGCVARVVVSAVFGRSGYKYGDRTYRYVLADAGHLIENLRVAAAAMGLQARIEAALDDRAVAQALGLDPNTEGVLALLSLHGASTAKPNQPAARSATPPAPAGAPAWPPAPQALDITQAMHLASGQPFAPRVRLGTSATAAAQASAPATSTPSAVTSTTIALPGAAASQTDMLALIAQRRSVRRFRDQALPWPRLAAVLGTLADTPAELSQALRLDLVASRVQGLGTGAWRLRAAERRLQLCRAQPDAGALRRQARAAALDQEVIGDAAAVLVVSADRASLAADAMGPARGWRHALIEAGLVGERVYLAAGAQGLAVCAVGAFYDDEAATLVAGDPTREWVLHLVALGEPA